MIPGTTARVPRELPIPAIPSHLVPALETADYRPVLPPPTGSLGLLASQARTLTLPLPTTRPAASPESIYAALLTGLRHAARHSYQLPELLTPELKTALAEDRDVSRWLQLPPLDPKSYASMHNQELRSLLLRDMTAQLAKHAGIVTSRVAHHAVAVATALGVPLVPAPDVREPGFPSQHPAPPVGEAARAVDRVLDANPVARHQAVHEMLDLPSAHGAESAAAEAAAQAWWSGDLELTMAILQVDPEALWPQLAAVAPEVGSQQNSTALLQTDTFRLYSARQARGLLRHLVEPFVSEFEKLVEERLASLDASDRAQVAVGVEIDSHGDAQPMLDTHVTRGWDGRYKVEVQGAVADDLLGQAVHSGGDGVAWYFETAADAAQAARILAQAGATAALGLTPFGGLMAPALRPPPAPLAFLRRHAVPDGAQVPEAHGALNNATLATTQLPGVKVLLGLRSLI